MKTALRSVVGDTNNLQECCALHDHIEKNAMTPEYIVHAVIEVRPLTVTARINASENVH
jgi:prophage tail gpP-like protein